MKWIAAQFLVLLLCLCCCHGFLFRLKTDPQCVPITIPQCKRIGYNMTRPVDIYSEESQNIKHGQKYISLVDKTKCSRFALFFLCSVYSPICFKGFKHDIRPCKSVCYSVKKSCGKFLRMINVDWPAELECESLPEHSSGMCIQPNMFLSATQDSKTTSNVKPSTEKTQKCRCKRKEGTRFKHFKKADFVLKGRIMSRETTANGRTKIFVDVSNIIKEGRVRARIGKTKLWAPSTCICPDLNYDEEIFIIGHESQYRNRLMFDTKTRLLPHNKWKSKISKWIKKCFRKKDCKLSPRYLKMK